MADAADDEIEGFLRTHGPFENRPLLANGDNIGEWTICAFLGRGGSAEVYRAENKTTGIVAALKVICKADDRTRERFRREARLLAEIGSSAFPKFYEAGCADGRFYIAEELLEPMALPRTDAEVARFVLSVAAGVAELHSRGFVHRDIKPRNVMMRPATGESVLIDMGLAKEGEDASQIPNDTVSVVDGHAVGVGTPGFSAPEQFMGGKIGPATDIHALGMLANACFKGKPPRAWMKIIRRSTSSIPEQRYATVHEFATAIRCRHLKHWWGIGIFASTVIVIMVMLGQFATVGENSALDRKELVDVILGSATKPSMTNAAAEVGDLFSLGKTQYDNEVMVTRIALKGKDVLIPGEIRLDGKRRIEISGPGRLTASITGTKDVSLELGNLAALINLTKTPYPRSGMKYVLDGACYLNFKNLDSPEDDNVKNVWLNRSIRKGQPIIRFRGPDSYDEVKKEVLEYMKKGIYPFY